MDDMVKLLDARAARPELLSRQPLETVCRCVHPDGGVVYRGGLVQAGVVTIDDTTIEADVSVGSSVTRRRIVDEILGEAEAVDSAEALAVADRRGDESPDRWVDCGDRRVRLRKALRRLGADPEGGWARILRLSGSRADPDLRVAADRPGSLRARAALGESLV
jgi:hypothetical protein